MILGILSDTHGETRRTADALRLLRQVGAEALVHCGDVGGAEILDQLAGWRAWIQWGNTDPADDTLVAHAESLGLSVAREAPLRLDLAGHHFAVFHGHEPAFLRLLGRKPAGGAGRAGLEGCDYVLCGHQHVASDARVGRWRVINPGALHRAEVYTVATLDLSADDLKFWQVFDDAPNTPPTRFYPNADPSGLPP